MARSRFGCITRLGSDHYHVKWTENGKQRSKRIRGTRDDALAFLAQRQTEAGGVVSDMTWSVYWRVAVEPSLVSLEEKTSHEYRRIWTRDLEPRIGKKSVKSTTWRQVESVLSGIESSSIQRSAFRIWRKICNMAVRDGLLDRNPVDKSIKLKPHKKREKQVIEAWRIGGWMETIRATKYEPLFLLELGGGLRHEEACAMVWENIERHEAYGRVYALVNVERGLVTIGGTRILKGVKNEHSKREVVIGEPFASRLLELHKGEGPVCGMWEGGPYAAENFSSPNNVTNNWRLQCKRRGFDYMRPGDMRSSFATLHGEAGTPDSLVSLAMGHADGGTTKTRNYQQRTRRGLIVAADSLTDYLLEEAENG